MQDLKHMITFEKWLEDASNPLIKEAQDEGKYAIGYTCYHMPEVLLNLDNCFSVRMRAPRVGSIDISTYYMSNYTCEFARSLLENGIEGGYGFLDGIAGVDACSAMNRCYEHLEILKCNEKPHFFVTHTDVPYKVEEYNFDQVAIQMRERLLAVMHEKLGTDVSDEAIRKAVELHNEMCRVITEIGNFRKEENPRITGYEFHVICLASYCCPTAKILPYLKETLEEIKTRKPDDKNKFRARVLVVGSEIDDLNFSRLLEESGAMIVADRFCYGSFPGREEIKLNDHEDIVRQIARHYMLTSECPRYMAEEKVLQRKETVDKLAKEFKADGIIYEQMKYCDFWAFERPLASHIMTEEYGWPTLSIDRSYNVHNSGQLRTRFQAFVEALEIKKIRSKREVM
ncbi:MULTISPECIES: 2-hydroxyacyl-CoA dehydratase family protein [unclassified Butyrivibrio]|uniref:2-hydroxyacyl-CoA dehydratase family protein n=1 Tax=unclassified Butyrivibrio TaxID=2639466 RepID=UPI0003FFF62A|nr:MULTISPECIES: 2-hydroxyacyl-CoA dehydratase family protein [unclassified Butyrivibrio]SCY45634.1 Benzoyl-CoA reductase/2-hydroxyglutaryl-CoA dehydratase subunit, BcrC/BadD/HgdB [Butyrivibrio sp. INlla14]